MILERGVNCMTEEASLRNRIAELEKERDQRGIEIHLLKLERSKEKAKVEELTKGRDHLRKNHDLAYIELKVYASEKVDELKAKLADRNEHIDKMLAARAELEKELTSVTDLNASLREIVLKDKELIDALTKERDVLKKVHDELRAAGRRLINGCANEECDGLNMPCIECMDAFKKQIGV